MIKNKHISLILFLLIAYSATSQKSQNIWYAGVTGIFIDFNSGSPVVNCTSSLTASEGSGMYCNPNTGDLIMYTNGQTVKNGNNNATLSNGSGLNGNSSATETAMVLPKSCGNLDDFYIFTNNINKVYWSEVDLTAGTNGSVIAGTKNTLLQNNTGERLGCAPHSNGRSGWIILTDVGGVLNSYHYDAQGINTTPVVSTTPFITTGTRRGSIIISEDYTQLVISIESQGVWYCDYDISSGTASNFTKVPGSSSGFSACFSPDGTKIYYTNGYGNPLRQYDITTTLVTHLDNNMSGVKLGPDGVIYTVTYGVSHYGTISNPNLQGLACNYTRNGLSLNGCTGSWNLPNQSVSTIKIKMETSNDTIVLDCTTDSIVIGASYSSPMTYLWDNGLGTASSYKVAPTTSTVYRVTGTDTAGCSVTDSISIIVGGANTSTTLCKDTILYLNNSGSITIDSSFIDNGSTNSCGIATIKLSKYNFTCNDPDTNLVTMVVTNLTGQQDSCTALIIILDTISPTVICRDTTIYLDASGNSIIDSSFINNSNNQNCRTSITLSKSNFNCNDAGINSVTMYLTTPEGFIDSCTANVTVIDTFGTITSCNDTSIYLTNSGVFIIDSSFINNGNNPCGDITLSQNSLNCSNVGQNNVTLYVTRQNGSVDSCTSIVTLIDTIKPNAICKDITIYLDSTGELTIDSSYIDNGSYDLCGIASIKLNKYTFNCDDSGLNNIVMTVTDNNGNINSCSATLTIVDTMVPYAFAGLDDSICSTFSYNLNANTTSGIFTGTWSVLNGPNVPSFIDVNMGNTTINNLIEGQYSLIWTVNNTSGCNINSDTINLHVYESPKANAGTDTSLCNVFDINLEGNILSGTAIGEWSYLSPSPSIPNFADINDPNTNVSNLVEGSYTLVWTVSNGSCIEAIDYVSINVYNEAMANAGPDQNLCGSYAAILFGNTPGGSSSGVWSVINGPNNPNITTPNSSISGINGLIEGTYTMAWTVSNGNCSSVSDTTLINVYNPPTANAGSDSSLCAIYNIDLYATPLTGNSNGQWLLDPSYIQPSTPIFSDSSAHNSNISNLVEGKYTLLWIIRNGNCAPSIDTLILNVWDQPTVNAGVDTNLCALSSLDLYATPISAFSQGTWSIDNSANNPNTPIIANPNIHNTNISNLIEGTYTLIWRVTNGNCFDFSDTIIINMYNQPIASAGLDQDLCFQNSTIINATPLTGLASGTWYLASSSPNNPTFNPNNTSTTIGNMMEGATYSFYWEAINGTCPISRDSITINNFAVPIANFLPKTNVVCQNGCIEFTNLSTIHNSDSIIDYKWYGNGDINNNENPLICYPNAGIFSTKLIVESSHGCKDTLDQTDLITVNTSPIADFNFSLVADPDISTKFKIQDNSQFSNNYWYNLGDGNTSKQQNFNHIYPDSGIYNITQIVSNEFGCFDTLIKPIIVHVLLVYIPNAFTPSGDHINETFIPYVSGDDPSVYLFRIYNRWGELIFQTQSKNEGWDGTNNGTPIKTDSYIWTLRTKYKDGETQKEYKGHVSLLR